MSNQKDVDKCRVSNFRRVFCAHSSCPFILASMAEEEVALLVVGHDSGTYRACYAGDDTPRACPVPVGTDTELDPVLGEIGFMTLASKLSLIRTDISC